MILRKGVEIKDVTEKGVVVVKFATLNVIDKDGDITLPGFFGKQAAIMLPAHDWKHIPLGKGPIHEVGDAAIAELQMNLDVPQAKDWHSWLLFDKTHGQPLQEYSYGFTVKPGGSSEGGQDASGQKAYRTLRSCPDGTPGCIVHEVSPVVVGAGEFTGTLAVKGQGTKFCDELETALAAVENLTARAASLADLRKKEGRDLSTASKERLALLIDRLKAAGVQLDGLKKDDSALRKALRVELSRSLAFEAGL